MNSQSASSTQEATYMTPYQRLVVPYDFSDHSKAALFTAVDLARHLKADCHLVHVVQPYAYPGYGGMGMDFAPPVPDMFETQKFATEALEKVGESIENAPGRIACHVVEDANVASAICRMAEKLDAHLIVMGTHGRTGIAHVFLGSVAERTLRHAPCPVLTVPSRDEEAAS
jgi:universal stress protein A